MLEPLYQKTIVCDHCNTQFPTSKVRSSVVRVAKTDSDFCAHYKDINPNFYDVRVCPSCGNATTEKFTVSLNKLTRQIFQDKIGKNWSVKDYGGERTVEDAIKCYKLALLNAQIREERALIIAQLCHHIAWFYRFAENQPEDQRFLGFALKNYEQAYINEKSDFNLGKLMYLIGELYARTGNHTEAIRWYGKVVNDRSISEQGIVQMARDRWTDLRTPGTETN